MTVAGKETEYLVGISTHTLTWSVTSRDYVIKNGENDFNSHAHVERDIIAVLFVGLIIISTHTLTWSVTLAAWGGRRSVCISTHTLTWSVTRRNRLVFHNAINFNSHAHVERDSQSMPLNLERFYFNSHAHVERDTSTLRNV